MRKGKRDVADHEGSFDSEDLILCPVATMAADTHKAHSISIMTLVTL